MSIIYSITRELDESNPFISDAEWKAYLQSSGQFYKHPENDCCYVWKEDDESWLQFHQGEISTQMPSEGFIKFMISEAKQFDAIVRGFDGMYFRSESDCFYLEDGIEVPFEVAESKRQKGLLRHKRKRRIIVALQYMIMAAFAIYFLIHLWKA